MEALQTNQEVLKLFWALASLEQEERETAARGLVDELAASQAEHEQESASEEEDGAAGGKPPLLRGCSPLVVYSVRRLCRGLASSRQGARQGFALGLAAALARLPAVATCDALAVMDEVLEPVGKGTDLRDALLGQVFGCAAVVESGRALDGADARGVASRLLHAAQKKAFLREVAASVLLQLCAQVSDAVLGELVAGVERFRELLQADPGSATPDGLLLALRLWPRLPGAAAAACPLLPKGCAPPPAAAFAAGRGGGKAGAAAARALFAPAHLRRLAPALRASSAAHPRLHGIWPSLLALLVPGFAAEEGEKAARREGGAAAAGARPGAAELGAFWEVVVEGELVQSSHERKYLAISLFNLLLPHLGPEHIPLVFTPSFLRCLALNVSKRDAHLHAIAKKCLARVHKLRAGATDPKLQVAIAVVLQRHGLAQEAGGGGQQAGKAAAAERAGGTPAAPVEAAQGAEDLAAYVQQLQATFCQPAAAAGGSKEEGAGGGEGTEAGRFERQWAVEQLCGVAKQPRAPLPLKLDVLRFLGLHAFFSVEGGKEVAKDPMLRAAAAVGELAPALRQLCAARLIGLTNGLANSQHARQHQPQQQQQGGKEQHQAQADVLEEVMAQVQALEAAPAVRLAGGGLPEPAAEALVTLWQLQAKVSGWLAQRGGNGAAADAGTSAEAQRLRALLHLACLLQLYALGDPSAADPEAAADVLRVAVVACGGGAQRQDEGAMSEDDEAPHWHDTLVDVLLSLLARSTAPLPSAPLREAVEHVFRAFAADLTATGLEDLLRVLVRPLDAGRGGGEGEEDDVYEGMEEEEEEEEEEEVEEAGGAESGSEEEAEEEEEEASSGGEDEEAEGMAAAVAVNSAEEGAVAPGPGSESESEEDEGMGDDAMFRMDAALAATFSTMKQGKGASARLAREELLHFKMRVAVLLEAFIKRCPASPLLPAAAAALLGALAAASAPGAGHAALAERLAGLLVNRLAKSRAEASGAAGVEAQALAGQLRRALYLASRAADRRLAQTAAATYLYLQRVAAGAAGTDGPHPVGLESGRAALADHFGKKKSRLGRGTVQALVRRVSPALGAALLPALAAAAGAGRSEFVQAEAWALVGSAMQAAELRQAVAQGAIPGKQLAAALGAAFAPGAFAKPQRQSEALKAACQLAQAAQQASGGLAAALGAQRLQKAQAAAAAAAAAAVGTPRVEAAAERLLALLRGEAPAPVGGKQAAKPKQAKQQQGKAQAATPNVARPMTATQQPGKQQQGEARPGKQQQGKAQPAKRKAAEPAVQPALAGGKKKAAKKAKE